MKFQSLNHNQGKGEIMQIKVYVAVSKTMSSPPPSQYQFLFEQQLEGNRNLLTQSQLETIAENALDIAVKPLMMTTGSYPSPFPLNWDSQSHFTAWRNYDFGLQNKYCVRIDIV